MSLYGRYNNLGSTRTIGDSTQVPNIGRITWQAEVMKNQILSVEMKSNHLVARVAFNTHGSLNSIEIERGRTMPIRIAFDETGELTATQDGSPLDEESTKDAMSICYCLFGHAAVHRKLAEVMQVEAAQ